MCVSSDNRRVIRLASVIFLNSASILLLLFLSMFYQYSYVFAKYCHKY